MNKNYYLQDCPLGHKSALANSTLKLHEGLLRICNICGQLVSSCSKEIYDATMQQFNTSEGTLPSGKAVRRGFKIFEDRLNLIQQYLKKPSSHIRLLDLGCSSGSFLKVAKQLGFQAEGVEPARKAAMTARENGFTVHIGTLEDINLPDNSFDAITLFEVIEHIPDPVLMLNQCGKILKSGGILMIGTGNTDSWTAKIMQTRWDYFDMGKHGGHISFFNKNSIKMIATLCKFKPVYVKTRALKVFEKGKTSHLIYKVGKLFSEILSLPVKWFNCGHDMLAILQK